MDPEALETLQRMMLGRGIWIAGVVVVFLGTVAMVVRKTMAKGNSEQEAADAAVNEEETAPR